MIHIVTYHHNYPEGSFAELTAQINQTYAERHGYSFLVDTQPPGKTDCHINWTKIEVIERAINRASYGDYVLWIDADAFFYSQELKIEYEMIPLLSSKACILIHSDIGDESHRWNTTQVSTGVMLFKVCNELKTIINIWKTSIHQSIKWPLEQRTLSGLMECFPNNFTRIKDYYVFDGIRGNFIRHMTGCVYNDEQRKDMVIEFIERYLRFDI
jgi:hypothetical protein